MTIFIVRHGETEWSASGRHTGSTDVPLTDAGCRQARWLGEALAAELNGRSPVLVLSSPRSRARDTARLAGLDPTVDDDLVEWDYGAYDGRTTPEIRTEVPGWTVWTHGSPGGENAAQVEARADRVLARAGAAGGPDDVVVLVGHGHFSRVLGARWIGQPATFGQRLLLGTASLSVLGHEHGTPAIARWNDRHHLTA
jgi:probable phosphoglycerate mutase